MKVHRRSCEAAAVLFYQTLQAKKFVEEAGGRITADSKVGEGTTFTVFLPVAEK